MREIWIALGVMALCVGVFFTVQLGDSGSNATAPEAAPDASTNTAADSSNPALFANVAAEQGAETAEAPDPEATATETPAPQEPQLITTDSGLQYIDLVEGTGATPQPGQTIVVHYTGTLENGQKFDSSLDRNSPFSFRVGAGQVIKGWDEGFLTMKVGGKRKLVIPPELGYGSRGIGPIPPNSTLIIEVELLRIAG